MLLIALVGIAMVIVIVGLSMEASNKEEQVSNLWLQNIEALVSGEGSSTVFCYGEGSVSCPNGTKAEIVGYMR